DDVVESVAPTSTGQLNGRAVTYRPAADVKEESADEAIAGVVNGSKEPHFRPLRDHAFEAATASTVDGAIKKVEKMRKDSLSESEKFPPEADSPRPATTAAAASPTDEPRFTDLGAIKEE